MTYFPCIEKGICPYGILLDKMPSEEEVFGSAEEELVCDKFKRVCAWHYYAKVV